MQIRSKLIMNAVVTLACIGVVGFTSFLITHNVTGISISLVDSKAVPIVKINKIEKTALEIWLRLISHNSTTDIDSMVQLEEEITQWQTVFQQQLESFEKISGFDSQQNNATEDTAANSWQSFRSDWEAFNSFSEEILQYSQNYMKEYAQQLIVGDAKSMYLKAMSALHKVVDNYTLQMEQLRDGVIEARQDAIWFISGLTALVTLVVLALLFWISRSIAKPLGVALDTANQITAGSLSIRANISSKRDEISHLLITMNKMADKLENVIRKVTNTSEQIGAASEELSATAQSLSQTSSEQAASLEMTRASVEQMDTIIAQNTENANNTNTVSIRAADMAEDGGLAVRETLQSMRDIANKIKIIEDIAYQTNLLALNAAIEAARASKHGSGF
ncbi:methyl-accepting chemotaxis protein, partial [Candidatus Venteria ishoeyi]